MLLTNKFYICVYRAKLFSYKLIGGREREGGERGGERGGGDGEREERASEEERALHIFYMPININNLHIINHHSFWVLKCVYNFIYHTMTFGLIYSLNINKYNFP